MEYAFALYPPDPPITRPIPADVMLMHAQLILEVFGGRWPSVN